MKRGLKGFVLAGAIALGAGACDDNVDDTSYYSTTSNADCTRYTTCGTCTPVVGCGWCTSADGTGACASDPDYCTGKAFSWTWEPTGCRVAADASAVGDAGPTPDASDAATDVKSDVVDAATDR
jgi:hypothetical protein